MAVHSVRARLIFWYSAVLALSLFVFAASIWFGLRQSLLRAVDIQLGNRVAGLERFLQAEASTTDANVVRTEAYEYAASLSGEQSMRVWDYDGNLLLATPEQLLKSAPPPRNDFVTWTTGTVGIRALARPVNLGGREYRVELGASLQDAHATLGRLTAILLACIPAVLLLASGGGWWLSRRALAPVDALTRDAHALSVHNLGARLSVPDTGDELARLAEAWNGVLARLQSAIERMVRFTADASHELRTPVALVRATAEVALRQDRPAWEYRQALSQIEQESRRMSQLIEDLLALARADAGAENFTFCCVDLREAVQQTCDQLQMLAAQKQVRFCCRATDECVPVKADAAALRRLIALLADNAIKYTPTGGTVELWTTRGDSAALFEIRDTGPGITPEDLPHIFERFWRADKARTAGQGSGLGLSLAQSIVQAHGGKIEADSVLHQGSVFRVELPLSKERAVVSCETTA